MFPRGEERSFTPARKTDAELKNAVLTYTQESRHIHPKCLTIQRNLLFDLLGRKISLSGDLELQHLESGPQPTSLQTSAIAAAKWRNSNIKTDREHMVNFRVADAFIRSCVMVQKLEKSALLLSPRR